MELFPEVQSDKPIDRWSIWADSVVQVPCTSKAILSHYFVNAIAKNQKTRYREFPAPCQSSAIRLDKTVWSRIDNPNYVLSGSQLFNPSPTRFLITEQIKSGANIPLTFPLHHLGWILYITRLSIEIEDGPAILWRFMAKTYINNTVLHHTTGRNLYKNIKIDITKKNSQ